MREKLYLKVPLKLSSAEDSCTALLLSRRQEGLHSACSFEGAVIGVT